MRNFISVFLLVLCCLDITAARPQYALVDAYPSLTFFVPLDIQNAGDERMFVVEKTGAIHVIDAGIASTFLDLSDRISTKREAGTLGLAFPPDHAQSGHFFVFYIQATPLAAVVSRVSIVPGNPSLADPLSEQRLLEIPKLEHVHCGGQLAFDPRENLLFISIGDDRNQANAQNPGTLHGSILRIDPFNPSGGRNYGIPSHNPRYPGWREELFAIGLRNPWRMSLDPVRNTLWVGDVGETENEEIDRVVRGGNYGWPLMEGRSCYEPVSCDTSNTALEGPVVQYSHDVGIAVIGGRVYRGRSLWRLIGHYIFGDYTGGKVWAFDVDGPGPPVVAEIVSAAPGLLCAGVDVKGEVYFGSTSGKVYRLESTVTAAPRPAPPPRGELGMPYPNPFNPTVHIPVNVPAGSRVSVRIYDVSGALLATLLDHAWGPLSTTIRWDGHHQRGGRAAAGVYLAVLEVDGSVVAQRRLVLVK